MWIGWKTKSQYVSGNVPLQFLLLVWFPFANGGTDNSNGQDVLEYNGAYQLTGDLPITFYLFIGFMSLLFFVYKIIELVLDFAARRGERNETIGITRRGFFFLIK